MSNWEIAEFTITEGREDEFAQQVLLSLPIFKAAEGCTALQLQRAVDMPGRFLLLIEWDTVAHHTEIFTATEGFTTFVDRVTPLYAAEPRVFHTEVIEGGF